MKTEPISKYEPANVLIRIDTYLNPMSKFHGMPHYKVNCGSSEASLIGIENLLSHFGGLMQECHRLRWIIDQVDKRAGGTLVHEVAEMAQGDWERIECGP
jgi:hypothetical protein